MEKEIKICSTSKAKALEELIYATKERDSCKIEKCDMGKTVFNQKQEISHSLREHRKCVSDVQSESDTIQEEKTRLLDQAKMMQKENIYITGEISNIVANHAHIEEETLKLNTMASENIESIEEIKKKNDKSMTEKSGL